MSHQQQHQQHAQTQAQKAPPAIDWLSFPAPAVVDAPHPDLFDFELDNSLSAFDQAQVQLLTLDYQTDAFQYFRSETPQQGPPSVITASSESAYETLSQHSESLYNYSNTSPSNYGVDQTTYPADLALDLSSFNIQADLNMPSIASLLDRRDSSSNYSFSGRSGYDVPAPRSTYSASGAYVPASGIAPHHTAGPRAGSAGDSPKSSDGHSLTGGDSDPRKKYACPNCTRSFARAYNLKTHMATHDSHRLKPYVCSHRGCGRSFSRKHDLGRHLVSIHRDETGGSQYSVASGHSTASQRSESVAGIGMSADNAVRSWCDSCGRGFLGPQRACGCKDVK